MKFIEIVIKEGMMEKRVAFSEVANLIYSKKNSSGKTTFLRTILYALGYPIPSTKGIKFDNMEFWLSVENLGKKYKLYRKESYLSIDDGIEMVGYSLPTDFYDIMKRVTGCEEQEVIDNLLGAFYMDQEKGWTLLNRGKAIGNISFKIEELVRGLSGIDCEEQIKQLEAVKRQLKKYEYMHSVAKYQEEINEVGENLSYDTEDETIVRKIEFLHAERIPVLDELEQIKNILRKNKVFAEYIKEMNLIVQGANGEEIPVTHENLVGFVDNNDYLVARREMLSGELMHINRRISEMESKREKDDRLFKVQTLIEEFDADISKIQIDAIATQRVIDKLKKERKKLQEGINSVTRRDNAVVEELHNCISTYAVELGISETYVAPNKDYIFTDDLKSLTGTILHKIVFSFKLAYIKLIKEKTGLILPIILDSPSGREVEHATVDEMLKILQRDFAEHQLIVASIYEFDIKSCKLIEFKGRMFNENDFAESQ